MTLARLTTEARNPASAEIDRLSSLEIVRLMNSEDAVVAAEVARAAAPIAAAIDVIAERLRAGGRLVYIGAGTSGRLGVLDASECPPTFNSPPWQVVGLIAGGPTALTRAVEGAEDHSEQAIEDLLRIGLCTGDVLVGIATSGRTPYVVGGLKYARDVGAYSIGLSCNDDSELSAVAEMTITPIVGPEVIAGSTRLKAGTATKLVLNMLTTGAMVRLGKTYGNLMVDLQSTNQKLADRSRRIVAALTGLADGDAATLLHRAGGDVKTAVVVQRRSVEPDVARQCLAECHGQLRAALELPALTRTPEASGSMGLVLGVDGGGSKTLAWLARPDGDVEPLGVAEAGPSNPQSVGWAAALANIDRAISLAFAGAGVRRERVAALCLAIAGAGREAEQQRLRTWAEQRRIAERLLVTHDALPILAAGTPEGFGIALVAGTGSFAFGRDRAGGTARAGGWGYLFGDEGSGYDIARRGLHAVSLAVDGRGPGTLLTTGFLEALGAAAPADMLRAVYARAEDRQWIASLARVVLDAADAGDRVADGIIDSAVEQLKGMVYSVAARLDEARPPLALAGGLLAHADLFRERLLRQFSVDDFDRDDARVVAEPVAGTIVLARREVCAAVGTPSP
jgi:N-acetylmuramic acid 6-phosphate etherase